MQASLKNKILIIHGKGGIWGLASLPGKGRNSGEVCIDFGKSPVHASNIYLIGKQSQRYVS